MPELGTAERTLLLAVLDVRASRRAPWADTLDWASLVAVAREGKILATLAHRVASERVAVPDAALTETLREALLESAAYNAQLQADLARCVTLLAAAGVDCVALKGAVLMSRHYPVLAMRQVADLDLLIDPTCFEAGLAALRAAGFHDAEHLAATTFDGSRFGDALNAPHWHAIAPLRSPSGMLLDLHRRVPTSGFSRTGGFAGFLARSESHAVHGVTVHMSAPLDLAVHLCEHYALQNYAHPSDAPRLLCDLRVIFRDEPPWERMRIGPARQRFAVGFARALYDAAFHRPDARDPYTQLLHRITVGDPALTPYFAELSELRGFAERFAVDLRERPGFALRKLVPSRRYMAEYYKLDPRSARIYPLYVKRLFDALLEPLRRRA